MNIHDETLKMKLASPLLSALSLETRNKALALIRESLNAHKEEIFEANRKDLALAEETGVPAPVKKRLKFDEAKLLTSPKNSQASWRFRIRSAISLLPANSTRASRSTASPALSGVIGVIFEARPDALVQISSLCLKSGNCAILKGGKETTWTNRVLFSLIHQAAIDAGLPENCLLQAEQHNEIDELLECHDTVDLLIPRGSNAFVQYIMNHTNIPVLGHADGVCHIYVDKEYDKETAIPLIVDAKTQYPAACNAVETVLIHRDVAKDLLPDLAKALKDAGVKLRGTEEVNEITPVEIIPESESFHHEYVDLIIALKIVGGVYEAINHTNTYGSHHTDCILTQNAETAEKFMTLVDSANVYQNASTRFADGFRYGFGAEVGISTSKIHARGPVGLEGLLSYKYKLFGHGDIVGDYASGKKHFIHKDL